METKTKRRIGQGLLAAGLITIAASVGAAVYFGNKESNALSHGAERVRELERELEYANVEHSDMEHCEFICSEYRAAQGEHRMLIAEPEVTASLDEAGNYGKKARHCSWLVYLSLPMLVGGVTYIKKGE